MSACKQCGADVQWSKIDNRWHCHNADGSDHWDLCSKLRWEQTKATGIRLEDEYKAGYRNSVHGTKFERINALVERGSNYREDDRCKQCVPAWQDCPNNCPLSFADSHGLTADQLSHLSDIRHA